MVFSVLQSYDGEKRFVLPGRLCFTHPFYQEGHHNVFNNVEILKKVVKLKNKTDLFIPENTLLIVGVFLYVFIPEINFPFCRLIKSTQDVEECALTGAGGPHDGDERAFVGCKVDTLQDMHLL